MCDLARAVSRPTELTRATNYYKVSATAGCGLCSLKRASDRPVIAFYSVVVHMLCQTVDANSKRKVCAMTTWYDLTHPTEMDLLVGTDYLTGLVIPRNATLVHLGSGRLTDNQQRRRRCDANDRPRTQRKMFRAMGTGPHFFEQFGKSCHTDSIN